MGTGSLTDTLSSPPPLQALILMRNRSQLDAMTVLPLFFRLFRCQDKQLRHQLFKHIVTGGRSLMATTALNCSDAHILSAQSFHTSMQHLP